MSPNRGSGCIVLGMHQSLFFCLYVCLYVLIVCLPVRNACLFIRIQQIIGNWHASSLSESCSQDLNVDFYTDPVALNMGMLVYMHILSGGCKMV